MHYLYQAVVAIKQCNHGYCVACLRNMSVVASDVDTVNCKMTFCQNKVPKQIINRFLTKLQDTHFMVGIILIIYALNLVLQDVHISTFFQNIPNSIERERNGMIL